jgi:hypothetical protein
MKYMVDEMMENLAEMLKDDGIDCRTVHEWIRGTKVKQDKIHDADVRKFLLERKREGVEITLITTDSDSAEHVGVDGLPVIYVQRLVRDHIRRGGG